MSSGDGDAETGSFGDASDPVSSGGKAPSDTDRTAAPADGRPAARDVLDDADILHVITGEEWGGAPRVVELLATQCRGTAAVACASNPRTVERFEARGLTVHPQPHLQSAPAPVGDVRAFRQLRSLVGDGRFDLVHCHSTKAGVLGRLAARLAGTPTVFTVHGWGFYNTEYERLAPVVVRLERVLARMTDSVVCVSSHDRAVGRQRGILESGTGRVVHNGIPPVEPPNVEDPLAELGVDGDGVVVGSVGRLVEQKRPTALIAVGERLRARGHDVDVVWIGDGDLAERCRRRAADTGADRTHFVGFREDALALATGFDVFVLPSRFEGFPVTVLEAMHLGLPVVAYDVGGVGDAVVDGETGSLVAAGDRAAMVERIDRLLRAPALADRMGARGARRAAERFSVDRMVAGYERVYRDVLAESTAGPRRR